VLVARGLTAWARLLTHLTAPTPPGSTPTGGLDPATRSTPSDTDPPASGPAGILRPDRLPSAAATQLVHALAGLAVALAGS
jgi:hypothetical protein